MSKSGKMRTYLLAGACLLAFQPTAYAGELQFVRTSGDGYILIDPDEGVLDPGIQVLTTLPNNDDYTTGNGFSAQGPDNCLMANNGYDCDAEPKLGNRIKFILTGRDAFDVVLSSIPSGGISEYFARSRI